MIIGDPRACARAAPPPKRTGLLRGAEAAVLVSCYTPRYRTSSNPAADPQTSEHELSLHERRQLPIRADREQGPQHLALFSGIEDAFLGVDLVAVLGHPGKYLIAHPLNPH